jgi:hypothetical protein
MTSKLSEIYAFESPCEVDDGELRDHEDGWYCDHCQKTVVDASKLTRAQFDILIDRSNGELCAALLYDEDGEPVFATAEQRRWLQQLAGVGKLVATATIPPLLLAGCLESQPSPTTSAEAHAPTAVELELQEQEKVAASRLATFHIKSEEKKASENKPVNLDDALSQLNEMQRLRNERHGHPAHPSNEVIEAPLEPGEKMKIDMESHDVLTDLEVIQSTRKRIVKGRMKRRRHQNRGPVLFFGDENH